MKIASEGLELVDVAQNQLFRKNGWPAEEVITTKLSEFKKQLEEAN